MKEPRVGAPIDRVDGRAKVQGKATYSADVAAADAAHAVIVGATISRGRVTAMDTAAAAAAPGVIAVLTHRNAPRLPGATRRGDAQTRVVQVLQSDAVLYDGQPIALVVAETPEQARYAASLVQATYDELRPETRLAEVEHETFTPAQPPGRPAPGSSRGDFDGAFASAPVRVDETYTLPIENHNPMEPSATLAVWNGPDRVSVYDSTQWVFGVQRRVAEVFGIPRENVRVVTRFVGGAFGCKGTPWSHVLLAVLGARATGRPVRLVLARAQMFQLVGYRPRVVQRVSLGARRDGTLVAVRHDVLSETSRFDEFMEPSSYATRMLYACPNVRTAQRLARLDVSTPTYMRGPGESSGSFALESAMDELAHVLAMDPLALRLKNYAETDEDERKPFSSKSLRECYQQAAERFGWSRREPRPRSMRDGRWLVGWGMASATYPARQMPASAVARLLPGGGVLVQCGTMDIGTGTYTVMTQVAADALGLPVERVRFELGDTTMPDAPIEAGSMTVSSVGSAVHEAAAALRARVREVAGREPDPDVYVAVAASAVPPLEARRETAELPGRKERSCHSFGAQFVEVRVDEDLGTARVTRAVGAFAGGRILNAKTTRSQLLGGMVWGIGMALLEKTVRDEHSGRVVTKDLADYHVPVNADVPDIEVLLVPEEDAFVNQIGAKGLGELGIVGMAGALANAVFHATGRRVRDLPITPDTLLGGST